MVSAYRRDRKAANSDAAPTHACRKKTWQARDFVRARHQSRARSGSQPRRADKPAQRDLPDDDHSSYGSPGSALSSAPERNRSHILERVCRSLGGEAAGRGGGGPDRLLALVVGLFRIAELYLLEGQLDVAGHAGVF